MTTRILFNGLLIIIMPALALAGLSMAVYVLLKPVPVWKSRNLLGWWSYCLLPLTTLPACFSWMLGLVWWPNSWASIPIMTTRSHSLTCWLIGSFPLACNLLLLHLHQRTTIVIDTQAHLVLKKVSLGFTGISIAVGVALGFMVFGGG